MPFDWKRLDRDERRRNDRVALAMGIVFTVGGALSIVVNVLIHRAAMVTGSVVWLVLGLGALWIGLRAKRRDDG